MNFWNSQIEDKNNSEIERYMVSPNQGMISESFDHHTLQKSTTIDGSYKNINGKIIHNNHGISSHIDRSGSNYGVNDENEGVSSSCTWDLRKSSSYVSKGYIKHPKQACYSKQKPVSYHK